MALARYFLFAFLFSSACANAGILFEPYGGYAVGSSSVKYSTTYSATPALAGTSDSAAINGLSYGGRVALTFNHFAILGAEYLATDAKEKRNSMTTQYDWKARTLFAMMGFQAPMGFRLLGGYGFDASADESTTPDVTHFKGTAAKLLIGWHLPTNMAINLEYTIYHYTDVTVNNVTSKVADSFTKFDTSSVLATISFPFEFLSGSGSATSKRAHTP